MSRHVHVCPVEGRRVRHPDGALLGAEGARVERVAYWLRLRAGGDVTFSRGRKASAKPSQNEVKA